MLRPPKGNDTGAGDGGKGEETTGLGSDGDGGGDAKAGEGGHGGAAPVFGYGKIRRNWISRLPLCTPYQANP